MFFHLDDTESVAENYQLYKSLIFHEVNVTDIERLGLFLMLKVLFLLSRTLMNERSTN